MIIRLANQEDVPTLLDLIRELAVYEKAGEKVTITEEEFLEAGFGEGAVWKALVAEQDLANSGKKVLGMALFYTRYSTWKGKILYLEDIIVTQKHRGQGIGGRLLKNLVQYARENQFKGLRWQVLDWNQPAINFYAKDPSCKFDKDWINVDLELSE